MKDVQFRPTSYHPRGFSSSTFFVKEIFYKGNYLMGISPPNVTQIPNDLFDHWLPRLNEAELKVLLVLMRICFGFEKFKKKICITELSDMTGLEEKKVIKVVKSSKMKDITNELIYLIEVDDE